jgi:thioredoxin-like negative regulator of GroEL
MSLVNAVLTDLDQRQAANARGADADWLSGLQAADVDSRDRATRRHTKLLVLLALGAFIALALDRPAWVRSSSEPASVTPTVVLGLELPKPSPRASNASVAPPAPVIPETGDDVPAPQQRQEPNAEPVMLTDVGVVEVDDNTLIEVALSSAPEYTLRSLTAPDRTVLELANSRLASSGVTHHARDDSLISGFSTSRDTDDTLRLVFDQRRPARMQSATLRKDGDDYRLVISLAASALGPTLTQPDEIQAPPVLADTQPRFEGGEMERVPHRTAAGTPVGESYLEAVELYRRGRISVAEQRLRTVLAQDPGHVESRLFLATTLIEQGRAKESQSLLVDGLSLQPEDARLAKLAARLLVSAGEAGQALAVLRQASPELAADPDYHAFVAAVLQRLDRHREAIRVYQGVLSLDPGQGAWWVGLAISLEAESKRDNALTAYRQAQATQTIDANLRRYVDGRIALLKRRKNS